MIDRDNLDRAIQECGLTFTEVADRAGFTASDLEHLGYGRLPPAVLARLTDVLGLSARHFDGGEKVERTGDPAVVGAYLGEFTDGLDRDTLAEALGWTLQRLEEALAALDAGLKAVGLRLRAVDGRVALAGRLERTDRRTRASIERLRARPDLDPVAARFVWGAIAGHSQLRHEDVETARTAERRGLIYAWYGRLRVTWPVEYSLRINDRWMDASLPWDEEQLMFRPC